MGKTTFEAVGEIVNNKNLDKLGVMVATISIEFVKISPKKEMSEAAKKEAASRLKRYNKEHKKELL